MRATIPTCSAALREELDVTSPKDGCSPSGQCGCCTVLIDGKAVVSCQLPLAKVGGPDGHHARGRRRRRARPLRRRVRRVRRPAVRLLHPGHRRAGQGADRQEGRRPHPRRHGPPPRRPPVPLHRLREDPRRHRGGRPGQGRRRAGPPGRRRRPRRQVRGRPSSRSATAATSTTSACRACCTPRCASPTTPGPTCVRIDTAAAPRRRPAWSAVFTAADVPGELRVGLIHKDWPVFIPEGGRTSYLGDVLAVVVADDPPAGAGRGRARRGRLRGAAAAHRSPSPPSTTPRSPCGAPTATCCRVSEYARGDVDAALAAQRPRRARGVPDPAHRARLPRARVDARRARPTPTARHLHVYSGGQGVWDDRNQIAAGARRRRRRGSPSSWCPTAAPSAARRTWPTRPRPRWRPGCCDRPVKCTLSREESLLIHPKRHPIRWSTRPAATPTGALTGAAGPRRRRLRAPTPASA